MRNSILLIIKYKDEKISIGIANINENCIDFLKDSPNNNAMKIVKPDLDNPGRIAMACAIPIKNA